MRVIVVLLGLFLLAVPSFCQQQILLIGTKHQTPEAELVQILPVKEAVLKFKPDIICIEYPKPDDSVSMRYLYGRRHYKKQDSIRKAWRMKASDAAKISSIFKALEMRNDLMLRMTLRNIFYIRSDFGNADYQAFLIMEHLKVDSSRIKELRKKYPMFNQMKAAYRKKSDTYDEYNALVFPLAKELGIPYLRPIDDRSTSIDYEKFVAKLSGRDSIFDNRRSYYDRVDAYKRKLEALPPETNTWVYSNSPEIINDLKYVEGYRLDPPSTSEEVKRLSYFWALRNKKIANYINLIAKKAPKENIVVFFGASHVGPVQEELDKLPKVKYSVITLYDLIDK